MSSNRKTHRSKNGNNEIIHRVRSLLLGLEAGLTFENDKAAARKRSLLDIRDEIRNIAKEQTRSFCNCQQITLAESWHWQEFAVKMAIPCPIHGPCRLGAIVSVGGYLSDGDSDDRRLAELLREYHLRCLTYEMERSKRDET